MTYNDMLKFILSLTTEQRERTATVFLSETDEFIPVRDCSILLDSDVLDENHPLIEIDA